jgi:hypothetical protein
MSDLQIVWNTDRGIRSEFQSEWNRAVHLAAALHSSGHEVVIKWGSHDAWTPSDGPPPAVDPRCVQPISGDVG